MGSCIVAMLFVQDGAARVDGGVVVMRLHAAFAYRHAVICLHLQHPCFASHQSHANPPSRCYRCRCLQTGTPHVVINTIDKRGNGSGNGHGYGCGRCGRSSIVNSTGPSSGVIKKNKSSQVLSDAEILDHAITFIIAGHETTSQALTWSLYLLCEHPEWMSKAVEEVSYTGAGCISVDV